MFIYINPSGEYPRYPGDVQEEDPAWTTDKPLPNGWHQVEEVQMPTADVDQFVYEDSPQIVNGSYIQRWVVRDLTEQEKLDRDNPRTSSDELYAMGLDPSEIVEITRKIN